MIRDKTWRDIWGVVETLRRNRSALKTIVLVSGDVHHTYCMTGNVSGSGRPLPELLQITSSGFRTTIRRGFQEAFAEALSDMAFDFAGRHLVPGFMMKPGSRRRELALYKNAVAMVDISRGADVGVRVLHLAADDEAKRVDTYLYEYSSGSSYLKWGEPANTPYRLGEASENLFVAPDPSEDSSLEPGQAIVVDGQAIRTYVDAIAWYVRRRDALLQQKSAFLQERTKFPMASRISW